MSERCTICDGPVVGECIRGITPTVCGAIEFALCEACGLHYIDLITTKSATSTEALKQLKMKALLIYGIGGNA